MYYTLTLRVTLSDPKGQIPLRYPASEPARQLVR